MTRPLALAALLALGLACQGSGPAAASDEPLPDSGAAIDKDCEASLRWLRLRLERERLLVKHGAEDKAIKMEAETLRHEAKCLRRYLWYARHDRKLSGRVKPLAEALDALQKKDAKASLDERKQSGFLPSPCVADPLGKAPPKAEPPAPAPARTGAGKP